MKFVAAKCPSCNGELQVPDDKDFVKCMYCSMDIKVREAISIMFSGNATNLFNLGNEALKVKNFSVAYDYFSKALEVDYKNMEGWFGKAIACGYIYQGNKINELEIISCFEKCISHSSPENYDDLKMKVANELTLISRSFYDVIVKQKSESKEDYKIKIDNFVRNSLRIYTLLERALYYSPLNVETKRLAIDIGKDVLLPLQVYSPNSESKKYIEEKLTEFRKSLIEQDSEFKKTEIERVANTNLSKKKNEFKKNGVLVGVLFGIAIYLIVTPATFAKIFKSNHIDKSTFEIFFEEYITPLMLLIVLSGALGALIGGIVALIVLKKKRAS